MNTPDPLKELRNYVGGQVVASEKAIAYINQLHKDREKVSKREEALRRVVKMLQERACSTGEFDEDCSCWSCSLAKSVLL